MKGLSGKTAIVTGAGSGIGREVAIQLAEYGVSVGLIDLNSEGLESVANHIKERNGKVETFTGSVTDRECIKSAIKKFTEIFDAPITIGINCAGIARVSDFLDVTDEEWDAVIGCHLTGTFIFTQLVSRAMVEAGVGGSLINTGSSLGKLGAKACVHYAAAKAGVTALSKSVARALTQYGIRCNTVLPGYTSTPILNVVPDSAMERIKGLIPFGRLGTVEEIAAVFCFLASDQSSYMTGAEIQVDGGFAM